MAVKKRNGEAQVLGKDIPVKKLPVPETGSKIHWDSEVGGFGCRVWASGARSYILDYRTRAGRQRRYTIGDAGDWTVGSARIEARRLRRVVDEGGDPMGAIQDERAAPTMADLCDRFEAEHLNKKRASTAGDYRGILKNHVRPHFGRHTKVSDVQFEDVDALHAKIQQDCALYRQPHRGGAVQDAQPLDQMENAHR